VTGVPQDRVPARGISGGRMLSMVCMVTCALIATYGWAGRSAITGFIL
jgi:hypothetical protein